MSLPVVLGYEAEFDEAVDWYEQKTGSGSKFIARLRDILKQIGQMPELHAIVKKDIRRAVLGRYPYSIFYRIQTDQVEVIVVFHSSRDPSEWQRRA